MAISAVDVAPPVEYSIEVKADVRITADDARRRAARFLLNNVGNMISAGQPVLHLTADRIRWKVPVLYGLPGQGVLGQIGHLVIHIETGEVLLAESAPPSVEEVERRAEELYQACGSPA